LKGFPFFAQCAAQKIENVWFCSGGFSYAIHTNSREAIRAILVFQVKFDVVFTRQAVNFSVELVILLRWGGRHSVNVMVTFSKLRTVAICVSLANLSRIVH